MGLRWACVVAGGVVSIVCFKLDKLVERIESDAHVFGGAILNYFGGRWRRKTPGLGFWERVLLTARHGCGAPIACPWA